MIETARPIAEVARELGINEGTLGNWTNRYHQEHADDEPLLNVSERARLRELERSMREVKMENDLAEKAAAYFRSRGRWSALCGVDGRTCASTDSQKSMNARVSPALGGHPD